MQAAAIGPGNNIVVQNILDPIFDTVENIKSKGKEYYAHSKDLFKNSETRAYLGSKVAPYSSKARAVAGVTKTIGKEGGRVTWTYTKSVSKWSKDVLVSKWDKLGFMGKCTRGLTIAGGVWSVLDGCKAGLLAREVWMGAGPRTSFSFQMLNMGANLTTAAAMMLPAVGLLTGAGIAAPLLGVAAFGLTAGLNLFEKMALGNSAVSDFATGGDGAWFKMNGQDQFGESMFYKMYYTVFVKWLDEGVFGIKTWAFAQRDSEKTKQFLEKNEVTVNDLGMNVKSNEVMTLGVSKAIELASYEKGMPQRTNTFA